MYLSLQYMISNNYGKLPWIQSVFALVDERHPQYLRMTIYYYVLPDETSCPFQIGHAKAATLRNLSNGLHLICCG